MADYNKSVFINCPFDDTYKNLFEAMIFTVIACDFQPRCSREFNDADDIRIMNIVQIIKECRYSIHDISIPNSRLNMPLELGLFLGCKHYGKKGINQKSCMILEANNYDSKPYLSDLAGQDFYCHNNSQKKMIESIRAWLGPKSLNSADIPHSPELWKRFKEFDKKYLPAYLQKKSWIREEVSFSDYVLTIQNWLIMYPLF